MKINLFESFTNGNRWLQNKVNKKILENFIYFHQLLNGEFSSDRVRLFAPTIFRSNPAGSPTFFVRSYAGSSATSPAQGSFLHSRGTEDAPTPTQNNDYVFSLLMWGYGTGGYDGGYSGAIVGQAIETFAGTSNRGLGLEFDVRAAGDASASPVFFLRKNQATFGSVEGTGSVAVKMGALTASTGTFAGAVSGITTLSLSSSISGGTTISCSGSITGNGQYYSNNVNNYLDCTSSGNSVLYSRGSVAVMVDNDNNSVSNFFAIYNNGSTSDIQFRVLENVPTFYGKITFSSDATYDIGEPSKRAKDIYASNATIQTSDARYKEVFRNLKHGNFDFDSLEFLKKLNASCGRFKDDIKEEQVKKEIVKKQKLVEVEEVRKELEWINGQWIEKEVKEIVKKALFEKVHVKDEQGNLIYKEVKEIITTHKKDTKGNLLYNKIPSMEKGQEPIKIPVLEDEIITKIIPDIRELPVIEEVEEVTEIIQHKVEEVHKRTHFWFINQELEEVLNDMGVNPDDFAPFIHNKEHDMRGIRYAEFIPILWDINQKLLSRIEKLEEKVG